MKARLNNTIAKFEKERDEELLLKEDETRRKLVDEILKVLYELRR